MRRLDPGLSPGRGNPAIEPLQHAVNTEEEVGPGKPAGPCAATAAPVVAKQLGDPELGSAATAPA